jgi:RNA polymerase sigma factor (sigma-70 family)
VSPSSRSLRLLQSQPDWKLVALCRAGQEPAFEALVRRYRGELLEYCRRLGPRDAASDDIVQQALLQAWQALAAKTEVRDVRSWLYRIVHNVAVSRFRAAADASTVMSAPSLPQLSAGVEQVVEQRIAARAVLAGLAELPERQRQAMLSIALDGKSHDEVAAALGLSSGSVRGLIYRARAKLRAAAAAVLPWPLFAWALRRTQERSAAPRAHELIAGGGGSIGVAGVLVKGGAAISLAGAVTGATLAFVVGSTRPHRTVPLAAAPRHHRPAGRRPTVGALAAAPHAPTIRLAVMDRVSAAVPAAGPRPNVSGNSLLAGQTGGTEPRAPSSQGLTRPKRPSSENRGSGEHGSGGEAASPSDGSGSASDGSGSPSDGSGSASDGSGSASDGSGSASGLPGPDTTTSSDMTISPDGRPTTASSDGQATTTATAAAGES